MRREGRGKGKWEAVEGGEDGKQEGRRDLYRSQKRRVTKLSDHARSGCRLNQRQISRQQNYEGNCGELGKFRSAVHLRDSKFMIYVYIAMHSLILNTID